jgi:hypothetical protein
MPPVISTACRPLVLAELALLAADVLLVVAVLFDGCIYATAA